MTKNPEFQKELNEKIKPGVKASDLKKLKRSKSADDLPAVPVSPTTRIKNLEDEISVLALQLETSEREKEVLEVENKQFKQNPPTPLLQEQLKEKQKEVEELRKHKEDSAKQIGQLKDNILELRLENIQDFGKYREKLIQIRQELDDTVEQASEELTDQDKRISKYRTNQQKAQSRIQELEKDFDLAERLAELRKYPLPNSDNNLDYLKYAFYSLCAITLTV